MKLLARALRELGTLFFDDASLAIAILFVLAASAFLAGAPWVDASAAAAFLVAGVVAVLVENFLRTAFLLRSRG